MKGELSPAQKKKILKKEKIKKNKIIQVVKGCGGVQLHPPRWENRDGGVNTVFPQKM